MNIFMVCAFVVSSVDSSLVLSPGIALIVDNKLGLELHQ